MAEDIIEGYYSFVYFLGTQIVSERMDRVGEGKRGRICRRNIAETPKCNFKKLPQWEVGLPRAHIRVPRCIK